MALVQVTMDVRALERAVHEGVVEALEKIVVDLQRELKLMLSKPGTGKVYFTGRRRRVRKDGKFGKWTGGRRRQRSAPGEPPAAQTGYLRNSWGVGRRGFVVLDESGRSSRRKPTLRLGSVVRYAAALEYGYPSNNLLPRPYIRPTIDAYTASGRPQERVAREIVRALPKFRKRRR